MSWPSCSGLSFSSAIRSSVWLSSSSVRDGCGLLPAEGAPSGHRLPPVPRAQAPPTGNPSPAAAGALTSTEVPSATPRLPLQEHTLGGHLGVEGCLDVVHKGPAVRAVHPDPLPQGVFDVHLPGRSPSLSLPSPATPCEGRSKLGASPGPGCPFTASSSRQKMPWVATRGPRGSDAFTPWWSSSPPTPIAALCPLHQE